MANHSHYQTLEERTARGVEARVGLLPSGHEGWEPAPDRPDPVALIEEQNRRRDADLVPVRHGRMMASPFTFYRGAALIMATDLAKTPTAGLEVQLCGDAHLSNFGVFGSPERNLVFDINDFDETLPGPFEWDVKRLAASLTVAAQNNGFSPSDAREITAASVRAYREAMATFAGMPTLEVWYAHLSEDEIQQSAQAVLFQPRSGGKDKGKKGKKKKEKEKVAATTDGAVTAAEEAAGSSSALSAAEAKKLQRRFKKNAAKARSRNSMQALSKLTERVDGKYRIASVPPLIVPARELHATYGRDPGELEKVVLDQFHQYPATLDNDRRLLLERFEVVDWARKVVGVGSVGTRAFIVLLQGRDENDPLFLQVKEATRSVLEGPLRRSRYQQSGQRVVQGQRLMQATSDIFLGWTRGAEADRYFYWRQLRDMKGSAIVEGMPVEALTFYAGLCGWTMARAHARSGDPVAIAAYLGDDDSFDRSITDFSERYAAQNERDFAAFTDAIRTSRIEAVTGL
jgi:uncharacterized protein (DUF2252 family)